MQHPEEGLIHAWLDGALPDEESARIEKHVAECKACASAVADARGIIAASSRIVGHLDVVPGNVIPVAPIRKSRFISRAPWLTGIAAATLISIKLYVDKPERALVRADSAVIQPTPQVAAAIVDSSSLLSQSTKTVPPTVARAPGSDRRTAAENTTLPTANAAVQKSSVAQTQPTAAPISAPAPQRSDALSERVAAPEPVRAAPRSALGRQASGAGVAATAAAPPADRAFDAAVLVADTAFVGCYELTGITARSPALPPQTSSTRGGTGSRAAVDSVRGYALSSGYERFALVDEAAPTPGLLVVRRVDSTGRPEQTILGAGWRVVNGQAVVADVDGRVVITLRKTASSIVGVTPSGDRAARIISCR